MQTITIANEYYKYDLLAIRFVEIKMSEGVGAKGLTIRLRIPA